MKRILLVSATLAECRGLLKRDAELPAGELFNEILSIPGTDLLITGVGSTATAFQLGKIFAINKFDLAINIGLAGSFDTNFPPGTVVQLISDCFADLGAEDHSDFISVFELDLVKPDEKPFENGKLVPLKSEFKVSLPKADGITVNKVHGNHDSIEAFQKKQYGTIETMEGAAFFYACNLTGIPSVQIRAISNFVEPRNRNSWKIDLALKNLWDEILRLNIH